MGIILTVLGWIVLVVIGVIVGIIILINVFKLIGALICDFAGIVWALLIVGLLIFFAHGC